MGAEFDLEKSLAAAVAEHGGAPAEATNQLQRLGSLRTKISTATIADLQGIQKAVASAVREAGTIAEAARTGNAVSGSAERLQVARDSLLRVSADYYDRKLLDPYLKFASPEDEEAYRDRERRNREAIERELAKGTPEGDRKAADIMRTQLLDAKDHGADASPDFDRLWDRNEKARATFSRELAPPATPPVGEAKAPIASEQKKGELDEVRAALEAAGMTPLKNQPEQPEGPTAIVANGGVARGTRLV